MALCCLNAFVACNQFDYLSNPHVYCFFPQVRNIHTHAQEYFLQCGCMCACEFIHACMYFCSFVCLGWRGLANTCCSVSSSYPVACVRCLQEAIRGESVSSAAVAALTRLRACVCFHFCASAAVAALTRLGASECFHFSSSPTNPDARSAVLPHCGHLVAEQPRGLIPEGSRMPHLLMGDAHEWSN